MSDERHIEIEEPWAEADTSAEDAVDETGAAEEAAPALDPLAQAEAERDEYLAGWQRTQADFDNYRKRALRQHPVVGE